ncbi:hypothetical protein O7606_23210 [Micromonospora sp. WMMD882]|uniref:hypothetical protein n=1 Tax=Micromonospora sp. WMMD882 TaxID=3015151 RepID=UPI00248B73EB|nr:hypothetical protein [Micromonospora sp. WMMD882]WBB82519.1 hypothetical protein O7606_23210 [Micromonospora sp. WMMD882]
MSNVVNGYQHVRPTTPGASRAGHRRAEPPAQPLRPQSSQGARRTAAHEITTHLIGLGRRRIAAIGSPRDPEGAARGCGSPATAPPSPPPASGRRTPGRAPTTPYRLGLRESALGR